MTEESNEDEEEVFNPDRVRVRIGKYEEVLIVDDLFIIDLDTDMDEVAARLNRIGGLWAAAVQERACIDADYRRWRATFTKKILDSDPKMAEWKVKSRIEAHANFVRYKTRLAECERNVIFLHARFDSMKTKANQIQSKGAKLRTEYEKTGIRTPDVETTRAARRERVRSKTSKKRSKRE